MKIRKVMLSNLPSEGELRCYISPPYFLKDAVNYPPLGLLYLAAQINEAEVTLLDASCNIKLSIEETVQKILEKEPDVLGLSSYSFRAYALKTICERVSKYSKGSIRIIIGGPNVSLYPVETMKYPGVNYVLQGEGDYALPQLLQAISNGEKQSDLSSIKGLYYFDRSGQIVCNGPAEPVADIDALPFPRRSLLNLKLYSVPAQDTSSITSLISSRGCSFKCTFCDVPRKKIGFRNPENVVDEISEIAERGIHEISFLDDCFNFDPMRVIKLCRLIIARKLSILWSCRIRSVPFNEEMAEIMAAAGCNRIQFGVESTNDDSLRYAQKGITYAQSKKALDICRRYKIKTLAYLLFGFPHEDIKTLRQSEKIILNELRPDYIFPSVLFPLAGTAFYRELLKSKRLNDDFWARYISAPTPDFRIPSFRSRGEDAMLARFVDTLNRKFYLSRHFIYNNLPRLIRNRTLLKSVRIGSELLLTGMR